MAVLDPTLAYKSNLDCLQESYKESKLQLSGRIGSVTQSAKIEWPSILAQINEPPESLIQLFVSVIPQTAFRSLLDPEGRRVIASEPKTGHTLDWFNNLSSSA
ncbi:hypothetical protein EMCG_09765 [[Emmonsia] crescens]|uniref:Uncharacterized protein n=1 Tax=[Emmonsia] crescens TaxID=73230 RepID=A0A0G2J2N2_9EURO|nr:hypothetical protein EMCG_09765 [Emmonsia crescens UAMH 3008]